MRMKKYNASRILIVIEIIITLILLLGCFRKDELVDSFWGEDILELTTQIEGHREFCGDRITLTPGVYQVRIKTALSEGQSMYVQMKYESAYFKSLRNNGMTFFSNHDYADFEVYVLDKVPAAYVQCNFFATGAEALLQLEVWKTNIGNRMLLFIVLVFFAVLDFLIVFRQRILEGKITRKQQMVFWTLVAGIIIAYYPYLTNYFFGGDDSGFHVERIAFLADTLWEGISLPVRLEGTWLYGHGYASSLFYSDLFLFIPAILRLIGFSIMTSYKAFVLVVTIATGVIAYGSFKKCLGDEYAALCGSMIYLLAPYRIYNVYNRSAVGEYLAMTFLPLVCCGVYLLFTEDIKSKKYKQYKWYIILGMSAVLQSHLISVEMTIIVMVVICVIFWKRLFCYQVLCQLFEAAGIVLVINMWFWIPLLYMMNCDTYHMQVLTESDVQLSGILFENFFWWTPRNNYRFTSRNDVWVGAGAILLLVVYVLWQHKRKKKNMVCNMFALLSVITLVMSTTYFPWNAIMKIPGIGYIVTSLQFPWRWMVPATLFVSLLAGAFFRDVRESGGVAINAVVGIVMAIIIISAVYHVNDIVFEATPSFVYNEENIGTISVGGGEYLLSGTSVSDFYYHKPIAEEGLAWSEYEKNGTNVTITLDNSTENIRYLEIPLTGYKGYGIKALETQGEVPFITEERGAHGDLRIAVPAGYQGTINISYVGFALFHVAEVVSLSSLIIILGVHFYPYIPLLRSRFIKKEEIAE